MLKVRIWKLLLGVLILSKSFEKEIISEDTANSLWIAMVNNGIHLPKDLFLDYCNRLYEIDCEKFLMDYF